MSTIVGILLAAGASQRFGGNKLTQNMSSDEMVAVRACRNLMEGIEEVLAVVRLGDEQLATCLTAVGAKVVFCADAGQGMGNSLAFGVQNCPDASGWLIALADMPWIKPATITQVAAVLNAGALLAAPVWQGQRGHPVGFSAVLASELMALSGDSGAKAVIQAHRQHLHLIECDDPGILRDIDLPQDLLNSL